MRVENCFCFQNLAEDVEPTVANELPYVITYYAVKEENEPQDVDVKYDPSSVWVEKVICLDGGWKGVKLEGAVSGSRENTGHADMDGEQNSIRDNVSWGKDGSNANLRQIQGRNTDVGQSVDISEGVEHSDSNIKEVGENPADCSEIDNSFREGLSKDGRDTQEDSFRERGVSKAQGEMGDSYRELDNSFRERSLSEGGRDNQEDSFRERGLSVQGEVVDSFTEIEDSLRDDSSEIMEVVTEGSAVKALKGAGEGVEGVIAITVDGATGRVCCKDSAGREVNRAQTPDRELLSKLNSE